MFDEVIKLDPNCVDAYYNKGKIIKIVILGDAL